MKSLSKSDADALVAAAKTARARAYAPYSNYRVGAALRASGKIYLGANVENASYGLSICAERSAVAAAILDGANDFEGLAVVTQSSPPVAPCGMCRQTLVEFAADLPIYLANETERTETTLATLLPHAFRPESLK